DELVANRVGGKLWAAVGQTLKAGALRLAEDKQFRFGLLLGHVRPSALSSWLLRHSFSPPLQPAGTGAHVIACPGWEEPKRGVYSAAIPACLNMSSPSLSASRAGAPSSLAFAFLRLSKLCQTVFQSPRVAALEYSVARVSKKFACSTPLRSGASQGRGCSSIM